MAKIFENQTTTSEHATEELSVCIAVSLQMDKETLEKDFKNWGFIYLDEDGKPIYDNKVEPPFMDSKKAQQIIYDLDLPSLEKAVAERYAGKVKVDDVFMTTELN
jgi:tRNA pseudouridine-54 N-methylase